MNRVLIHVIMSIAKLSVVCGQSAHPSRPVHISLKENVVELEHFAHRTILASSADSPVGLLIQIFYPPV